MKKVDKDFDENAKLWTTLVQNIDNDQFSIQIGETFYESPE